ncbi:hypothetical protein NL108_004290 [Boleophthalmus pectinirostris]|uniref:mis18-binding protein 1 n=1 Tax=Boleophthalmus pectinirostris TaxID=150288 RepID=UPI00242E5587|nr:mis18-binding protein 1 [Boleophthalmus pectinirostris]KAJ0044244.1 hypothetical protein NL108_004290 [Boleophthalmus pectinirostris]
MASYHQIQHHLRAPFESPAKVFAKLKSKVQRVAVDDFSEDECQPAEFKRPLYYTPKRRTESHGTDKPGDFSQSLLGNGEVTAVTLSPISSPQKNDQYVTDCDRMHCTNTKLNIFNPACTPRRRALMESTAVCSTTAPQTHMDDFDTRASDRFVLCEPGDLENAAPPRFITPNSVFSPMRKRLRKRKSHNELWNKPNSMMSDTDYVCYPEKERKINPAFREVAHITNTRNVEQFSKVAPSHKGCTVDTLPHNLMSPAKMFIYLKERENQRDQCDVPQVTSCSGPEVDQDIQNEMTVGPESTASSISRQQSPNSGSSDADFPRGPVSDVPVLLEDPLMLNSPRFSIPKTQETVYRRAKWSSCTTFPSENVIHLRKWFIRGSHKGLFLDGIHRENNIPWNSNIILDRVSNSVLKTISGRVYILVGKMDLTAPTQFPKWFLKCFVNGFPSNWKELHKKYLSESKGNMKKRSEAKNYSKSQKSKTSMNQSLKQQQQTSPPCPSSAASSTKMSRSGRVIKPPLEYWMGGRVILDADMNVTIHDSYRTVIQPEIITSISTKSFISTKPDTSRAWEKVPMKNMHEKHESSPEQQLQRKVKAQQRKPRQHNVTVLKKTPSPVNTNTNHRVTRSSKSSSPTEKTSENPESQGSKNTNKLATIAKGAKVGQRSASSRRTPPNDTSTTSQPLTNKDSVCKKTKDKSTDKSWANLHCKPARSSRSSNSSQERESRTHKSQTKPVKDVKTQRKRRTKTPSQKNAEVSAPVVTQKTAQPNRTGKRKARIKAVTEQDENKWTEEELRKLHEAVSCHPKHITGYWTKVAMMVGTRSAEECQKQHTFSRAAKTPSKYERKTKKGPLKEKANPVISARVGTLMRKQQVRDYLEAMPKEDMDDIFSTAYMQNKRFEVPSMCTSDHDFSLSDQEPVTPKPTMLSEAKTPQCLHITPSMMGSSSRNYDDKYVFKLQKRMKNHHQFNVEKHAKKVKGNFTPIASVKKPMRRCGNTENDTFVVWEMFPDKEETQVDSDEEEDFYFTESD